MDTEQHHYKGPGTANPVQRSYSHTEYVYDENGRYIARNEEGYREKYMADGTWKRVSRYTSESRIVYHANGYVKQIYEVDKYYDGDNPMKKMVWTCRNYDQSANLTTWSTGTITWTHENGRIMTMDTEQHHYDGDSNLIQESFSTRTYIYEDGRYMGFDESGYRNDGDGNLVSSYTCESRFIYDEGGNIVNSYYIISRFDSSDKLTSKTAEIKAYEDGETTKYNVVYDVDDDGNVIYTHVYDADGNEIGDLSGEGFRHPSVIIGDMNNPIVESRDIKEIKVIGEPVEISEMIEQESGCIIDEEILQRQAVELKVQKQASDRFCPQMATQGKPTAIQEEKK